MLVTRSIVPFLSIRRSSAPKCCICTAPACVTASMAVARKTGGIDSGPGRSQLLDHTDFHASVGDPAERPVVHEAAHEEDPAAARLQEVFGRERVGDFLGLEALALVE